MLDLISEVSVNIALKTPKSDLACWAHVTVLGALILKTQTLSYVHKTTFRDICNLMQEWNEIRPSPVTFRGGRPVTFRGGRPGLDQ